MISIIIPTLNEEKYLPKLLQSIEKQNFTDYEMIVADAGSTDRTVAIAREHGCRVVKGGTPAKGRNSGARAARGSLLFFFDADVILPPHFLEKAYGEIERRYIDVATCRIKPLSKLKIDKLFHVLANDFSRITSQFDPHAPGFCILISKRLFNRIKGFDESLKLAEDHDLVKRATKFRNLEFISSVYIYVSVRRLKKEGRLNLARKYLYAEAFRMFKGQIKRDIIDYEFGNYKQSKSRTNLDRLESRLIKLEHTYTTLMEKYTKERKHLKEKYLEKIRQISGKKLK